MNSEFDKRQLDKMQQLIGSFKSKDIPLSSFVSSVEFLFHSMEFVNRDWEELLLDELTTLESINAGVPKTVTDKEIDDIIAESVNKIGDLIKLNIDQR